MENFGIALWTSLRFFAISAHKNVFFFEMIFCKLLWWGRCIPSSSLDPPLPLHCFAPGLKYTCSTNPSYHGLMTSGPFNVKIPPPIVHAISVGEIWTFCDISFFSYELNWHKNTDFVIFTSDLSIAQAVLNRPNLKIIRTLSLVIARFLSENYVALRCWLLTSWQQNGPPVS